MEFGLWRHSDAVDHYAREYRELLKYNLRLRVGQFHNKVVNHRLFIAVNDVHSKNISPDIRDCRSSMRKCSGSVIEDQANEDLHNQGSQLSVSTISPYGYVCVKIDRNSHLRRYWLASGAKNRSCRAWLKVIITPFVIKTFNCWMCWARVEPQIQLSLEGRVGTFLSCS